MIVRGLHLGLLGGAIDREGSQSPTIATARITPAALERGDVAAALAEVEGWPAPRTTWLWRLDGAPIGAEQSVAVPAAGALTCVVTATNAAGATSVELGPVAVAEPAAPPTFIVAPSVAAPTVRVGQTLLLEEGVAAGSPAPTMTGRLTLDGIDVTSRMQGLAFTPDAAGELVWTVTARNTAGAVEAAATAAALAASTEPAAAFRVSAASDADFSATMWGLSATAGQCVVVAICLGELSAAIPTAGWTIGGRPMTEVFRTTPAAGQAAIVFLGVALDADLRDPTLACAAASMPALRIALGYWVLDAVDLAPVDTAHDQTAAPAPLSLTLDTATGGAALAVMVGRSGSGHASSVALDGTLAGLTKVVDAALGADGMLSMAWVGAGDAAQAGAAVMFQPQGVNDHAVRQAAAVALRPMTFDGAVGFGRFTTGGRGKPLYTVTNTAASGPGSLAAALTAAAATGGGRILIEAEGGLQLPDRLRINVDNLTIDASGAPGMGFWFQGGEVWFSANNVIARNLRFYPGSNFVGANPQGRDAVRIDRPAADGAQENLYFENCDFAFGLDETLSVFPYDGAGAVSRDITFHNCIVAESCHANLHVDESNGRVGDHGKAILFGPWAERITFYGGLIVSHDDRAPRTLAKQTEMVSTVVANYGATSVQIAAPDDDLADHGELHSLNNAFLRGPQRPPNAATASHRILMSAIDPVGWLYETGAFTGRWTAAGGFDAAALASWWRYDPREPSNPAVSIPNAGGFENRATSISTPLFTPSQDWSAAPTAQEAFLSLGERVGARNALGQRHPLMARVIGYTTAATPFETSAGWHGAAYARAMIPDEARAIGATVASGAATVTVTLPAAATALPGATWTGVNVAVVNAYAAAYAAGSFPPSRTANSWAQAISRAGALAGGPVAFSGLPAGFYVVRLRYTAASGATLDLYTGRPVVVT